MGWKTPEARKQYEATHKEQRAEWARHYRKTHRKEISEYRRARRLANLDKEKITHRKAHLRAAYGITLDEYNAMYISQEGKCAICGKHSNRLCVDHNHLTGSIRSLLCLKCNSVIGMSFEDTDILKKAIEYIDLWRKKGQ